MPRWSHYECTIHTSEEACLEYPALENDDETRPYPFKTVYIEAAHGQEFSFKYSVYKHEPDAGYNGLSFQNTIDGVLEINHSLSDGDWYAGPDPQVSWREKLSKGRLGHAAKDGESIVPYIFSILDTTDDDAALHTVRSTTTNLGCIEVQVFRINADYSNASNITRFGPPILSSGPIHEKIGVKRNLDSRVQFGKPRPHKNTFRRVIYLDVKDKPLCAFRFLYRTKAALQRLGIIAETPAPSSPPRNRDLSTVEEAVEVLEPEPELENLTREELLAMLKAICAGLLLSHALFTNISQKQRRHDVKPAIKRENDDNGSSRSGKRARNTSKPAVIDLTDD